MSSASFNLDHALCAAFPAALNATAIETNSGLLYTAYDLERGHRQARGCLAADAIWASLKVNLANDKVPKWCMVLADLPCHAVATLQKICGLSNTAACKFVSIAGTTTGGKSCELFRLCCDNQPTWPAPWPHGVISSHT